MDLEDEILEELQNKERTILMQAQALKKAQTEREEERIKKEKAIKELERLRRLLG